MRGEYSTLRWMIAPPIGPPPLARGIQDNRKTIRLNIRNTPACAGTTNSLPRLHSLCQDHPPSCAGNTGNNTGQRKAVRDHPLMRGEYLKRCFVCIDWLGPPPQARGTRSFPYRFSYLIRTTPAGAGNTNPFFPVGTLTAGPPPLARGIL